MEYYRTEESQIYADIAYRLGKIILQYDKMQLNEEKFETTLCLAVLQNLLTQSNEHIRKMSEGTRKNSIFYQHIENEPIWGITAEAIKEYTFHEDKNLQNILSKLRNTVSHPNSLHIESEYPGTGYTTIRNEDNIIEKFVFINSPDVGRNGPKQYNSLKRFESFKASCRGSLPIDINYKEQNERFIAVLNGVPFIRIARIELDVHQLREFTLSLVNYLAQPIKKDWDGMTIHQIIAA
jgi:hypothetical protein